jgi:hypothetical protein
MPLNAVRLCAAVLLGLLAGWARADGPAAESKAPADEVRRVADHIDALIAKRWKEANAAPAEPASDAELIRRLYLHLDGGIPPVSRVREYLNDSSPDKHRRLVDQLLEGPGYVVHFTRYWRRVMLPETDSDLQTRFLIPGFEGWLRDRLTENTSYDQIARQIIDVQLTQTNTSQRNDIQSLSNSSPLAFYQAKQVAPENLAASTSRIFLGIRIECAQCHDHPFDSWKRDQFWSLAAFFGGIVREGQPNVFGQVREIPDRREISIPDSDMVVQAGYLDGSEPQWRFRVGARKTLADWVASKDNPYFAKAAANRIWGHFFGRGIVEPVDDFSDANPPSHPELLNYLAQEFAVHEFDLKFLIRAITASKTYRLSSQRTHESQDDPELFARMNVQGLTPNQLYDSLAQATGARLSFQANNPFLFGNQNEEGLFQETFDDGGTTLTNRETTILQALALMNGQLTANATNLTQSRTLAAVVGAPFLDTEEKIEALYLAALSRKPSEKELSRLKAYVESGGPAKNSDLALADVFWALLNSSEFLLNH